jgi:hypothetical protein
MWGRMNKKIKKMMGKKTIFKFSTKYPEAP